MGGGHSQQTYDRVAAGLYDTALRNPCLLPNVGVDETLQRYSSVDSNAQLQDFSDMHIDAVPDYITDIGMALAGLKLVPNAVGIGAMVISMIIELIIKDRPVNDTSYDMLQRIFGEEKASAVRDTMSEYVGRHRTFINNENRLVIELLRLEAQLYHHLTKLRNSLLHDGQMSTRGFNIWVNGASFHAQMLIHGARLGVKNGKHPSDYTGAISLALEMYLEDLDRLMEKFKEFESGNIRIYTEAHCIRFCRRLCRISNREQNCNVIYHAIGNDDPCDNSLNWRYNKLVFSKHEPISSLRSHFLNIKNNLNTLISQHDSFTPPSAAVTGQIISGYLQLLIKA